MEPIRKSITVKASPERAFEVFTEGIDNWWPREHHIGSANLKKAVVEAHKGGRLYTEQTDGTEADWGQVLVWEPHGISPALPSGSQSIGVLGWVFFALQLAGLALSWIYLAGGPVIFSSLMALCLSLAAFTTPSAKTR